MEKLRLKLNEIDEKMRSLFEERLSIVSEIGEYKRVNDLPIYDEDREVYIIESNLSKLNNNDYRDYYKDFIKLQLKVSKDLQKSIIEKKKRGCNEIGD